MSRSVSATNQTESEGLSIERVVFVAARFDTPVFVHSNIGSLTFAGDTYTGIGELGAIGGIEESERLQPSPITFEFSGVVSERLAEALDAGNYGDVFDVYEGFLDGSGQLVDDPIKVGGATFEHSWIEFGEKNKVVIVTQHDLSALDRKSGRRWTDEDVRAEYPDDEFCSMLYLVGNRRLLWGGVPTRQRGAGSVGGRSKDD